MRQAGILASAGLYALKNNIDGLKEDHQKAQDLAKCIALPNLEIDLESVQTNILIFEPKIWMYHSSKNMKEKVCWYL
jgi:threonine aldolase